MKAARNGGVQPGQSDVFMPKTNSSALSGTFSGVIGRFRTHPAGGDADNAIQPGEITFLSLYWIESIDLHFRSRSAVQRWQTIGYNVWPSDKGIKRILVKFYLSADHGLRHVIAVQYQYCRFQLPGTVR